MAATVGTIDIPELSVGEDVSMDGLTKEEEEELERQLLMSPPIMESPCPSELDTHSRSGDESILGNEDVRDEECDMSVDGAAANGKAPEHTSGAATSEAEEAAMDKLFSLNFMEKVRITAVEGVKFLLMGKLDEARELFAPFDNVHPLMANGAACVDFFQAVIAFDDDLFPVAKNKVAKCQKVCKIIMQQCRKQLKHQKGVQRGSLPEAQLAAIVAYYEARISIADCWCFSGVLTACRMTFGGYLKASLQMKRAFAIYKKVYKELNTEKLTRLRFPGSSGTKERDRLLTSSSFGYGVFHLALSLVPPSQLILMKIVGMAGDRRTGLLALRFCVEKGWGEGIEPRSPVALFVLVWYYTHLRPMMTLSKLEKQKSVVYAKTLMTKYRNIGQAPVKDAGSVVSVGKDQPPDFGDLEKCVLFTFIRARIARSSGKIYQSIEMHERMLRGEGNKKWMKELNQVMAQDISWCKMAQLKYASAGKRLMNIHENTRWSKINNLFPSVLTMAVRISDKSTDEEFNDVVNKFKQIKSTKASADQQELYYQSRACLVLELLQQQTKPKTKNERYKSDKHLVGKVGEILLFECCYFASILPRSVTPDALEKKIVPTLKKMEGDRDFDALARFLQGVIYRNLNNFEKAQQYLKEAIEATKTSHKRLRCVVTYGCIEMAQLVIQRAESKDPKANEGHKIVEGPEVTDYLHEAKRMAKSGDLEARVQFLVHNYTKTGDELWNSSKPKTSLEVPKRDGILNQS